MDRAPGQLRVDLGVGSAGKAPSSLLLRRWPSGAADVSKQIQWYPCQ